MIQIENLRKEYDDVVAVQDLNVTIPEGEIYGLIGPNGAGKTSTIRMACGLLEPTGGKVSVAGVNVHQEPERAQEHIGYLSDFFSVYEDLKVWEYLDYFAHAYKMPEEKIPARIEEAIAQVGLGVKRDTMVEGLSRGMKQRLGIARAIIHRPKLLLLDEPASGLDPKGRIDLRNLLRSLRDEGTTVVVSSHILTELEGFCTSIGLMEKGVMVRSGTIHEITTAESRYSVVRVNWAGDGADMIESALQGSKLVSDPFIKGRECVFKFFGTEDELAALLRTLVTSGVDVVSFGEVKQTVEDIYLKLSQGQVT